ncbi:MAG: hypothetical protein VB099_06805 [Candidatus Limiplasma sp.]|nr:hypothetical protein [Candidatus Limiplasma sp.]
MKQEFKAAFCNARFWIAFVTLMICLLGFSLPTWIIRCQQGDRQYLSAFNQAFAPIFFGGAILLFPFCATLPYAVSQVQEIRTGFLFPKAIRTTTIKYALIKVLAVSLSGAAAMGLASLLHSLLWHIVAGAYDPVARPEIEVFFSSQTVYDTLKDHPYAWTAFAHAALGFAITGALWATIGLAVAVWIPDTLLVMTIPVVFYYFWSYQFLYPLFKIRLPSVSALYNDGQYWHMYWEALLAHAIVFGIAAGAYYLGLKRRLRNV